MPSTADISAGKPSLTASVPNRIALSEADREWVATGSRAQWARKFRRLARAFRDPGVAAPAAILLFIVVACFLGPTLFNLYDPNVGSLRQGLLPIGTPGHPLGTNNLGNDLLSRLLHGGQVSILVGIVATGMGFLVGMTLGAIAGVFGGIFEAAIMRIFDALYAFPSLIIALAIAAYLGPSVFHTMIAIALFTVSGFGRLARGQTIRVRNFDYIVAARSSGMPEVKIVFQHVIPNIIPPLISLAVFNIGSAMVVEAGLSYLGLGIRIPDPSWGNLIADAQPYLARDPTLIYIPATALFVTVLAITLLSDGFRRRLAIDR
ncbi:ABC transporter permease [Rhizobium jaguaris]|nr:ABC transporter permease [Rhizobium jaguaris]